MQHRHEMNLPQPESFYTTPLAFDVKVDSAACGTFTLPKGTAFTLGAPTVFAHFLAAAHGTQHTASIESVSLAALRFFRSGDVSPFAPIEYANMTFLTRYQWGLAFQTNAKGSLEHQPRGITKLHSEAMKIHTEHFAYGLAVHFTATLLGIPIDRFFFLTAAGARPDFRARVSATELSSACGGSVGALSATGYLIALEVKARTGWASYRHTSDEGVNLLYNLSKKATTRLNHAFLSVIVSLPDKTPSLRTRTKLILADPGDPVVLGRTDQAILLLEESLPLLLKHGLWPTLSSALHWLRRLRGALTDNQKELLQAVKKYSEQHQYKIVIKKTPMGRSYNGRVFNDVILRLGQVNNRGMTRTEAKRRLALDQLGHVWYSGADTAWINIVQSEDTDRLLGYGVRGVDNSYLSAQSAFFFDEEPLTDEIRAGVRNILRLALKRW